MTREDVQDLLVMVQATYPNYNPPSRTAAVNAWTMALEEYSKDEIAMAFKVYMQTNTSGFAPAPGQLIDKIHSITQPQELNEMEAWALVSRAIRNSAYNSAEEYAKLPPAVQKAVGLPSQLRIWALDEDFNEQVVMSQFQRCYRTEVARAQEIAKMPTEVRQLVQNIAQGSSTEIDNLRKHAISSLPAGNESRIKVLEDKSEGVPIPDRIREKIEEMRKR